MLRDPAGAGGAGGVPADEPAGSRATGRRPAAPAGPSRLRRVAPVRFRITAIAALGVAAVLVAVGAGLVTTQRRVLTEILDESLQEEAAAVLGVSVKTVETHRRSLMGKLALFSVAELTKYAIREGLTTVEI